MFKRSNFKAGKAKFWWLTSELLSKSLTFSTLKDVLSMFAFTKVQGGLDELYQGFIVFMRQGSS